MNELTPIEIVRQLDRYIIGQDEAKRLVAVALRNRYRRSKLDEKLIDEVSPKNILMIGPTGVGKTEIARRLAKLVNAPFIKVEATKFTEVGYVGRDVESIIRDLTENAVRLVKAQFAEKVEKRAKVLAEDRLLNLIVDPPKPKSNPFDILMGGNNANQAETKEVSVKIEGSKEELRQKLMRGELEDKEIEIEVEDSVPSLEVGGNSINIGDMMGNMMPKRTKIRRLKIKEARKILIQEETSKLIDMDEVNETAIKLTRC